MFGPFCCSCLQYQCLDLRTTAPILVVHLRCSESLPDLSTLVGLCYNRKSLMQGMSCKGFDWWGVKSGIETHRFAASSSIKVQSGCQMWGGGRGKINASKGRSSLELLIKKRKLIHIHWGLTINFKVIRNLRTMLQASSWPERFPQSYKWLFYQTGYFVCNFCLKDF